MRPDVLSSAALDRLMPMHLQIGPDGRIARVGPTLARISSGPLLDQKFLEKFEVRRPRGLNDTRDLVRHQDAPVYLAFRDCHEPQFRSVVAPLSDGGVLANMSFGIAAPAAIRAHGLHATDFAATDPTVELLYLIEANAAVRHELQRLAERLSSARAEAEELAVTDRLTGLKNRLGLERVLSRLVQQKERFALVLIDLDGFKPVNDQHGHAAGDLVLRSVADRMRQHSRPGDVLFRSGGDEFVLIMPGARASTAFAVRLAKLIAYIEQPIALAHGDVAVSASIGYCASTQYRQPETARMLADADAALYSSKRRGGGLVTRAAGQRL